LSLFLIINVFSLSTVFFQTSLGLKDYYRDYFPIGVAVNPRMLEVGKEWSLILTQFNSMTPENVMKMGSIHPEENRYNWESTDKIASFAVKNGLKLRNHTLCWHNQTPTWFSQIHRGK